MELGIRELVTFLGMAVSVGASLSIVRTKLQAVILQLVDTEQRLRKIDQRIDLLDSGEAVVKQRVDILASLNSPDVLERRNRETASMLSDIAYLRASADRMQHSHPPVASERKGT